MDVGALNERCRAAGFKVSVGLDRWDDRRPVEPGSGLATRVGDGGEVFRTGALRLGAQRSAVSVRGRGSFVLLGDGAFLNDSRLRVDGEGSAILIGAGCRFKGLRIRLSGPGCLVAIGAGTTWESGVCLSNYGRAVILGDDCMISNGVMIRSADGHSIWDARTKERLSLPADVYIGPHVWLGNGSRVSKGARIGAGSVVGQMALVTGALKPHCAYGGVPARLLRENVEWSRTLRYESIPDEFRYTPPADPKQGTST